MNDMAGNLFRRNRKKHTVMLLSLLISISCAFPAAADVIVAGGSRSSEENNYTWQYDGIGWWYGTTSPSGAIYYSDKWLNDNGLWYFFDEDGYLKTGWLDWEGERYYFDPTTGAMVTDTPLLIGGITYNFDEDGRCTVVWPYKLPVQIPSEEEKSETFHALDSICDSVLASIINDNMTERQKATAIYNWIQNNFRYTGHSATRDWVTEAYNGLRRHYGDCYTYFAVSQALLTRAGFPSIEVVRYTDNDHYWNLTMVDGNWYHFDTTPRSWGRSFCLKTDAEMLSMSAAHNGCFAFDRSLYPPTP